MDSNDYILQVFKLIDQSKLYEQKQLIKSLEFEIGRMNKEQLEKINIHMIINRLQNLPQTLQIETEECLDMIKYLIHVFEIDTAQTERNELIQSTITFGLMPQSQDSVILSKEIASTCQFICSQESEIKMPPTQQQQQQQQQLSDGRERLIKSEIVTPKKYEFS